MLTYEDVLDPKGRLDPSLFDEDEPDRQARYDAYLEAAYARADVGALPDDGTRDDAAALAVYARAWDLKFQQMNADASTIAEAGAGGVTRSVMASQIASFRQLSLDALAELAAIVEAAAETPVTRGGAADSTSFADADFGW